MGCYYPWTPSKVFRRGLGRDSQNEGCGEGNKILSARLVNRCGPSSSVRGVALEARSPHCSPSTNRSQMYLQSRATFSDLGFRAVSLNIGYIRVLTGYLGLGYW